MADVPKRSTITGEEIDPMLWVKPATNGDLFLIVQHMRKMIFSTTSYTMAVSGNDKALAAEAFKAIQDADALLQGVVIASVRKAKDA